MQEIISDTIQADSVVVDTLRSVSDTVVSLPLRDSNLVSDMSHIFGDLAVKSGSFVDGLVDAGCEPLSLLSVLLFLIILVPSILLVNRYNKEVVATSKIIIYPTLFNRMQEVNSVHQKHYLTYAFIFSVLVISTLGWIYVPSEGVSIAVAVGLYLVFKLGFVSLLSIIGGGRSSLSRLAYFVPSFYATTSLVLSPVLLASIVFGPIRALYMLTITVLSSYYFFFTRYFCKEKFSFKQFLLYLCIAEVVPLALVIVLLYTKIIAFGN